MKKSKSKPDGSYDVGYGKPPAEHQFQPGKSGNQHGRPKGSRGMAAILQEQLDRKHPVTIGGVVRNISTRRLIVTASLKRAVNGSVKDADWVFRSDAAYQTAHPEPKRVEICEETKRRDAVFDAMTTDELEAFMRVEGMKTLLLASVAARAGIPFEVDLITPMICADPMTCRCEDFRRIVGATSTSS